jgi:hypothetical protein
MYCITCGFQIPEGAAFCASCGTQVQRAQQTVARRLPTTVGPGAADVAADLRATVEARRELGPDMEDHLVDSFLARLDDRIDTRVDDQVARRVPKGGASGKLRGLHNLPEPALVVGGSMALAIPLIGAGGEFSSFPVMIGVVLINLFYFVFRHNQ